MVVTFLPFADIEQSLLTLDKRRLGKQRVEASQILKALNGSTKGWINHPATKMWQDYQFLLKHYYNECLRVWELRGGKNDKLIALVLTEAEQSRLQDEQDRPWWWGFEPFHESHKAALVRKDDIYYKDLLDKDSIYLTLGYVWPHKHTLDSPFDSLFEPINPNQLKPKCSWQNCRNPAKYGDVCGVHKRVLDRRK